MAEREAEERILPLATGNRHGGDRQPPVRAGEPVLAVRGKELPPWAAEFDWQVVGASFS